jgi:hypothetical protein
MLCDEYLVPHTPINIMERGGRYITPTGYGTETGDYKTAIINSNTVFTKL